MRRAIYPGSFDPITNGHIDIIQRAASLFDELTIAVVQNKSKSPLLTLEERTSLVTAATEKIPNIRVIGYEGLLADLAQEQEIYTIIRGLRVLTDFDFEFQMALTNRRLCQKVDTVFLMTSEENSYLSSSAVREIASYNGDISSFVPTVVQKALAQKIKKIGG